LVLTVSGLSGLGSQRRALDATGVGTCLAEANIPVRTEFAQ
jgi:hypothetical protein